MGLIRRNDGQREPEDATWWWGATCDGCGAGGEKLTPNSDTDKMCSRCLALFP